ncbi:MAG: ATP-binding cassette domain-containing protein [Synergistaceae bacterium]|jgi:ABC-type glutathione transport system ATPase component|nr:ATP-binding cassette domain-containing protein [Synergistaceae bacterium]
MSGDWAVLEANGLGVRYRGRYRMLKGRSEETRALHMVSFSVRRGDTLAVVGESGSGKTTLLRCVLGLITPTSGGVELWGKPVSGMTASERTAARRRCGYVPQDPYGSLPHTMTVMQAVTEPWDIARQGEGGETGVRRARELLSELKLPEELWSAHVRYSLSGGQRQRVAIARSLILDPEILLCDEPTAMQDVSTRGEVLDVLLKRAASGMSLIIVTHDLLLARRAARRGLVLYRGEMVDEGYPADLLERPSHEYTRALAAALPRL